MEIQANQPILNEHPSAKALISLLKENSDELALTEAIVYHNFPVTTQCFLKNATTPSSVTMRVRIF
jgi:hypothetical protein